MIQHATTEQSRALEESRREILEHVARTGPVPIPEIPGRWPVTRHQIRAVVRELTREGLVALGRETPADGTPGMPLVTLTERGRALVAAGPAEDP